MRDGQSGQARSYLADHQQACGKVGITPDTQRYLAGREIGIREYCTAENGLREGRRGRSYKDSCPPQLERAFRDRYDAGYRVFQAQQRVDQLDQELRTKQRELDKTKEDRARARLRKDLSDLDQRLRRARDDVYDAERSLRY